MICVWLPVSAEPRRHHVNKPHLTKHELCLNKTDPGLNIAFFLSILSPASFCFKTSSSNFPQVGGRDVHTMFSQ